MTFNDGNFVLAVAKQEIRQQLLEALEQQWISFENAGGIGSIPRRAREFGASPRDRLRCFLLFDSDARLPGRPSRQAIEAADRCAEGRLPFHRLERRAIENYIPVPALQRWAYGSRPGRDRPRRVARVRAISRMTPDQRNHFNLADGFTGDRDSQEWPCARKSRFCTLVFRQRTGPGFSRVSGVVLQRKSSQTPTFLTSG